MKFFDYRKTIINEFVGGRLAMHFGLPVPKVVLVRIAQDLINLSENLKKRNVKEGIHIGSRFQNITDFGKITLQSLDGKLLVNPADLYGVVCFDTWVLNIDRINPENNMIEFLSDDRIRYWMIDFSHCFTGNDWTETSLAREKHKLEVMPRFNGFFEKYVTNIQGFDDRFNRLEGIPDSDIQHIIDRIPEQWSLKAGERLEISNTIKVRRGLARHIISNSGIL